MEISANELRIGNWIIEPGQDEDKPFQIFSIYHEDKNNKVNGLPIALMQPIPLTEDWLIRFGAKKYTAGDGENMCEYFEFGKLTIVNWMDGKYIMSNAFAHGLRLEVTTVHQLQNLYFALTGTELTDKN